MYHPKFRIDVLNRLTEIADSISLFNSEVSINSRKIYYAALFFGKIVLNAKSICVLVSRPKDNKKKSDKSRGHFDVSSMASLARNIIEAYENMHYISMEKISDLERNFRMDLMLLHHAVELKKIMSSFEFKEENITREVFKKIESTTIDSLIKNPHFQNLKEELKVNLLKGDRAYLNKKIAGTSLPLDARTREGIYKLLSNSVHSTGLSLINYFYLFEDNPLNTRSLVFISIEVSILYLAASTQEYINLRRKVNKTLSKDDKEFVKSLLSVSEIQKWINYVNWYDEQRNYI